MRVDIRFSKDPTPYKTYFSAAWSRTGRKGPYAHYYIQIQPNGGSFVGEFNLSLAFPGYRQLHNVFGVTRTVRLSRESIRALVPHTK
jgi:hypothetical protein